MSKYWNEKTRRLDPYICGEQPKDKKYIKLNTNENPYPPSTKVIEAIKKAVESNLNLYPDPFCTELSQTIAQYYGLSEEQVFIGNGSDEVLAFAFEAFFGYDKEVLSADITYSFYPVYAHLFELNYKTIRLNDDFTIPIEGFLCDNGGVIIANPNAPTALYTPIEQIERVAEYNYKHNDRVVIVDEAYIDFGGESAVKLINKYPNLLVIQTFSKSRSLAGLRVGFAMGHKDLIEGLGIIKDSMNSYTVDRLALAGAVEAIRDEEYFQETKNNIIKTRKKLTDRLKQLDFSVTESATNFVFAKHKTASAQVLYERLRDRGILIRYFNKPRIENYLRITVGSDQEISEFLKILEEILNTMS